MKAWWEITRAEGAANVRKRNVDLVADVRNRNAVTHRGRGQEALSRAKKRGENCEQTLLKEGREGEGEVRMG